MQILSYKDWYLENGHFNSQYALDGAFRKYQEALSLGYSGLRITGNLFWLDQENWDSFMEYESLLDSIVPKYKILVICVYKESKCNTDNIIDVIKRHKYVIAKDGGYWRLRNLAEV